MRIKVRVAQSTSDCVSRLYNCQLSHINDIGAHVPHFLYVRVIIFEIFMQKSRSPRRFLGNPTLLEIICDT